MTTIAYKKGIIACDKQANDADLMSKCASKMLQTDDNVYCIAGTIVDGLRFVDWLESASEEDPPAFKKTTIVCMDKKTGKATLYEGTDYGTPVEDPMYAWGSGGHLAIGAMAQGAAPWDAVEIASKWDTNTGLGVQFVVSTKARKRA